MYCNRLHAWWSAQSRLATWFSSLSANWLVGLQTLLRFRLKALCIDELIRAWCFGCLSGPPGFTCWISFALVFSFIYCWVLIFACSGRWCINYLADFCAKPKIYVSWSTSEFRMRLAPWNRFKLSIKLFYWPFQGGTSFVDLLCLFCFEFVMPLCASV